MLPAGMGKGAAVYGLTRVRCATLLAMAVLVFGPILLLSGIARHYADLVATLAPVEYGRTNLEALHLMLRKITQGNSDSWQPMIQALSVLHDPRTHSQLYETVFFQDRIKFQYAPTSLLPIDLLQQLHLARDGVLNALNLIVFLVNALAVSALSYLVLPPRRDPPADDRLVRIAMAALTFAACFLFYPLVKAKLLGQIQLWIDMLCTFTVLFWIADRRFLAGAMIGLACMIKPQTGILLVWALAWKEWRMVRGILFTAAPLLLTSLLAYGLHNHIEYLRVLSFLSRHGEAFFQNASMNGLVNRYLGNGDNLVWQWHEFAPFNPVVYLSTMAFALLCLAAILLPALRHRGRATALDLSAAFICVVVSSPIAWEHHYGILPPLYIVALHAWMTTEAGWRRRCALAMLAVSWTLTATFIPLANLLAASRYNVAQSYIFFGALLLLAVILWKRAWPGTTHVTAVEAAWADKGVRA